jgi:hypothetical protein
MFFKLIFLPAKIFSLFPFWGDLVAYRVGSLFYLLMGALIIIRASTLAIGVPNPVRLRFYSLLILISPFSSQRLCFGVHLALKRM